MSVVLDVENLRLIYNEIKTLYESYVRNRVPAEAISIATLMCRP